MFSVEKLCYYKWLALIKKSINNYTAYKVFTHSVNVTANDSVPSDREIIRKHLLQFLNSLSSPYGVFDTDTSTATHIAVKKVLI